MKLVYVVFFLGWGCCIYSCSNEATPDVPKKIETVTVIRDDLRPYYDSFAVTGSFVLFDQASSTYTYYNTKQCYQAFTPASTFKICNSLIGLETGVIKDENFVIPWNGSMYLNFAWNKDHDLALAYKNSTVWYYQELARRVGGKRMKTWLDKAHYGNADTSGGIDQFWLSGGLRITPKQQIDFLVRLHDNQLPFSDRTVGIVKKIMIEEDTLGYVLRAKTGWGMQGSEDIGWYVGYIEKAGKVYYFANCIQCSDAQNARFGEARTAIAKGILKELGVIEK